MKRPTDVLLAFSLVAALATLPVLVLAVPSAMPPPVMRGEVYLLPKQTFALSACSTKEEVWVTLGDGTLVVFPSVGGAKEPTLVDGVRGLPFYDGSRNRIYVSGSPKGEIYVVDATTHRQTGTIQVPAQVLGLTLAGDLAYANASGQALLYVIDLVTQRVVREVKLSQPGSTSLVVGSKLYVATGREPGPGNGWNMSGAAVDILDLRELELQKTLPVPGADLRAIAWDGEQYVYAASNVAGELVRIDAKTDKVDEQFRLPVGRAFDLVIDPVRRLALLACEGVREELSVISLRTLQETVRFEAGSGRLAVERGPDGAVRSLWVPNVNGSYLLRIDGSQLERWHGGHHLTPPPVNTP